MRTYIIDDQRLSSFGAPHGNMSFFIVAQAKDIRIDSFRAFRLSESDLRTKLFIRFSSVLRVFSSNVAMILWTLLSSVVAMTGSSSQIAGKLYIQ
jgi:hypothetical protein